MTGGGRAPSPSGEGMFIAGDELVASEVDLGLLLHHTNLF